MKRLILTSLIFILIFLNSGCLSLKVAYVPQHLLKDGWYEDFSSEEQGSGLMGLEKWSTKIYRNGNFAYLSVTSLKFIIMESRDKLLKKVENDIMDQSNRYDIKIVSTSTTGERMTSKGHKTSFVVYNGKKDGDDYKIIGEVWSCSKSGISVICIGFSDVSEIVGMEGWRNIVSDPMGSIEDIKGEGLIYNVICH